MLGASMEARLYTISTRCTGTHPGRSWMTPDCRSVRVHMLKRQCSARQATSIVGCGRLLAMTSWHPQLMFNFILDLPTSKILEGSWEIRNSSDWRPERECLARLPGWIKASSTNDSGAFTERRSRPFTVTLRSEGKSATAFGTRKGQKRCGKVPEKMWQRCHFLYTGVWASTISKSILLSPKCVRKRSPIRQSY